MLLPIIMIKIEPFIYSWSATRTPFTVSSGLENLIDFFFSDVRTHEEYEHYLNLLDNFKEYSLSGNSSFFEIKNSMVEIGHLYIEDLPEFITTKPNMIKILNDWYFIWRQQPPFIQITMDEQQNVTFTALHEYKS